MPRPSARSRAAAVSFLMLLFGVLLVAPSEALGDEPIDPCSLLSAEEVTSVTGLAALPGVQKETHTAGQQGCGWGTRPYEVQVAVMPSQSGPAVNGLGDSGYPVNGVGDGAYWWWCDTCLGTDSSSSVNHLVVAQDLLYVDIGFDPTTEAAADDSEVVQATHLGWAIELARLILPRLPSPGAVTEDAQIDVNADACSLLDIPTVQGLTGVDSDYATSRPPGSCFWGSVRPGEPGYVELALFRQRSLSDYSYGDGCEITPVAGVGTEAAFVDCPPAPQKKVLLLAYDRGAIVSLLVNEPADPLGADDLATVVRSVLDRLPTVAAAPTGVPSPAPGTAGAPSRAGSGGGSFSQSVPAPLDVSTDPIVLLQSVALAALLVFLMPFPSQLFNSTLETHEDEVRHWFLLDRLGRRRHAGGRSRFRWLGVIAFIVVAALLYGFLDPGFGLDAGSLATFLGMLLGIVLVTVAFAFPLVLAHRRHGDRPSLKVVPISLAVALGCVLVSRLTGFQPGYLYGILIGLAFAQELSATEEGRATAVAAAVMLGAAIGSWLLLGAVPQGDGFGVTVVRTALAALLVAGLEGVVFGLLPMRFLPGEAVYRWNRVAWALLLGLGAFAFFHILINPASGYLSDTSRVPLFTVVALLAAFSTVSVAFWGWFRFRGPTDRPA